MTDITELAQRMKAAAEKASGGDWVKESGDGWDATCSNDDQANSGFIIAHFEGPDAAENREFVQAANPANVKRLVEALEKAQQRITQLEFRTLKLPHRNLGHPKLFLLCPFPYYDAEDMEKALADAGIKVEAE